MRIKSINRSTRSWIFHNILCQKKVRNFKQCRSSMIYSILRLYYYNKKTFFSMVSNKNSNQGNINTSSDAPMYLFLTRLEYLILPHAFVWIFFDSTWNLLLLNRDFKSHKHLQNPGTLPLITTCVDLIGLYVRYNTTSSRWGYKP